MYINLTLAVYAHRVLNTEENSVESTMVRTDKTQEVMKVQNITANVCVWKLATVFVGVCGALSSRSYTG